MFVEYLIVNEAFVAVPLRTHFSSIFCGFVFFFSFSCRTKLGSDFVEWTTNEKFGGKINKITKLLAICYSFSERRASFWSVSLNNPKLDFFSSIFWFSIHRRFNNHLQTINQIIQIRGRLGENANEWRQKQGKNVKNKNKFEHNRNLCINFYNKN